jgi:hypothetical protein
MEGMELDPSRSSEGVSYRPSLNKRYLERHPVSIPATIGNPPAAAARQLLLENLSLDGSYFVSATAFQLGQELDLQLQLPGSTPDQPNFQCKVRVVRVEKVGERFGIGVSFR